MIAFKCQACGQEMQTSDGHAGRPARCAKCNATLTIPSVGMTPEPMPPAAAYMPRDTKQARRAFLCGLAGLVPIVGAVLGPMAVIYGLMALRRQAGKAMALAAIGLGIVGVLITAATFAHMNANDWGHGPSREARCMASLNSISKAVMMYGALTSDLYVFPLIKQYETVANANRLPDSSTKTDAKFAEGWEALGSNTMQNVWLLIDADYIGTAHFQCPSDRGLKDRTETAKYGWTSPNQFSYGMHFPYEGEHKDSLNPATLLSPNANPSLVMFADRSPVRDDDLAAGPSHHGRDGGGDIFAKKDGSVDMFRRRKGAPNSAGVGGDDIYTARGSSVTAMPGDHETPMKAISGDGDTFITPVPSR